MQFIDANTICSLASPSDAVNALREAFTNGCHAPERSIYDTGGQGDTLLVMPAWGYRDLMGVKLITITPANPAAGKPFIQGVYALFDRESGTPRALLDAPTLTNVRTAAASALASSYLSRRDSSSLLMVGAGSLAPFLINAHIAVRPVSRIYVWSRSNERSAELASRFDGAIPVDDIAAVASEVDIISCATPAEEPLVHANQLRPGQHLDLVGGFKPSMREVDDQTLRISSVYIDTPDALKEAGDLIIPIKRGTWRKKLLRGTLSDLCTGSVAGREQRNEITLFKSVGHALEDIAVADLVWQRSQEQEYANAR